jgi:GAF domain-containing protein
MKSPELPPDEVYRLQALQSLALLDSEPEEDFDALVRLGRDLFDVPICLVSLIDRDRQWLKARAGLDVTETPRDLSFCGHAILGAEVMVVPDARLDVRFHDNPFVVGPPHIRFYAGAPIRLPNGYTIGTVCLIASEPRTEFTDDAAARLAGLAELALTAISVRALRREADEGRRQRDRLLRALEATDRPVALVDPDGTLHSANVAFARLCQDYPLPGSSVFELTGLTASDLTSEATDEVPLLLRIDGRELSAVAIRDPDGYIILGNIEGAIEPG